MPKKIEQREYARAAAMMALGYNNVEIAKTLGVHRVTVSEWKKDPRFAELCRALTDEVQGLETSFHGPLLRRAATLTAAVLDRQIAQVRTGGQMPDLVLLTALVRELATAQREAAAFGFYGRPPTRVPPQHSRGDREPERDEGPESPAEDDDVDLEEFTRQMKRIGGRAS